MAHYEILSFVRYSTFYDSEDNYPIFISIKMYEQLSCNASKTLLGSIFRCEITHDLYLEVEIFNVDRTKIVTKDL